jgi:hypothetical protein
MATNTELVQQLYVAYFNRPADVAGLEYYVGVLEASTDPVATAKQISADFANATEYKGIYGGMTPQATINAIYHNLFGHEADIPGLKYWSDLYAAGTISLASIVTEVAAGAQTSDATAYANKVTAAAAFTDTIALSADQMLAYASHSDLAIASAQSYLAGVTDAASLEAALADVATTAAGVVPTVSKNLTVGADAITGGSGNDVFNAIAINAEGVAASTLQSADVIDGGAGTNTVNVTVDGANNETIKGTFKNIQIFNITGEAETDGDAGTIDVSKLGAAVKQVWQIGTDASAVTNLGATTTAGFKGTESATLSVAGAATVGTINVALKDVEEASTIAATGTKLAGVVVSGSLTDTDDDTSNDAITVAAVIGKNLRTFTLNSTLATTLTVNDAGSDAGKEVNTIDASSSTGDITYDGTAHVKVATIKGGAGSDTLTINTTTVAAAAGVTAVTATVDAGAGKNDVTVKTTGDGLTKVTTGAGDDTVTINTRSDGKLTVNLGAGSDKFFVTGAAEILAGDVIDAGAGVDSLLLQVVGSNNIDAFLNFEKFDVAGLDHDLDLDILSANNTVTDIIASAALAGDVTLENLGGGVSYHVSGVFTDANTATLTQTTAGALNIVVDGAETDQADDTVIAADVHASNATSVAVAFSETFVDDANDVTTDNIATLTLKTDAATAVSVASNGGDNATNVLALTDTAAKLTKVTITGDTQLTLDLTVTGTSKVATIDASASNGGLHFTVNPTELAAGANIKLGSGADLIDASLALGSNLVLTGFEKAIAAAVGDDADAQEDAIAATDIIAVTGAVVADDAAAGDLVAGGGGALDTITKGVLVFGGSGPATLTAAIEAANGDVAAAHDTVVFRFKGDTYLFTAGADSAVATDDVIVKLASVIGVKELAADPATAGHLFIV